MSAIYWLRNDLRLNDNIVLEQFSKETRGAFIYIESPSFKRAHSNRKNFLMSELSNLAFELSLQDQPLYHSKDPILYTLEKIHALNPIKKLFFSKEFATEEKNEEKLVEGFCLHHNIQIISEYQQTLIHPDDLPFQDIKDLPFIFTDFRKKIESNLKIRPILLNHHKLPLHSSLKDLYPVFECKQKIDTGKNRLDYYFFNTQKFKTYKETRNGMIDYDDSTKFSKWLNTGSLSPRLIYHELKKYEDKYIANESTYWVFFELLWRDYFKFLSLKYKHKIFISSGITNQNPVSKSLDKTALLKWKNGETGNDFINANMRELNTTGFMSNRGRQNVASFLIHDLKINWVYGAKYFEQKLIDYDPDINYGNWLYLSGNGTDPRARKFNIDKQANDYDPNSDYRKLWLSK